MNKNIFFFILVFLILIASATAVTLNTEKELLETTFSQPIIIVSYPEAEGTVEITNFSLIRDNISYDITYSTNDYITFNFTPNNPLNKGLYILKITAEDLVSNSITVTQPIQINAPFMKIWVDSPHLGFYSHKPFNAIIKSEFPAICKFDFTIDKPLDFNMFFSFNEGLDDYTTEHTIIDMGVGDLAFREDSPDEDGEQSLIRVECNDTYTALHMNTLYLGFDPSAPNITVELEELISDLTIPFTPLKVDTTDRSICSYEENGVTKYFGDHDLDNFSHYQKNHEIILNFTYLARLTEAQGLFIPKPFTYLISCTNLAGLPGEPVLKELEVAFERDFSIIKYKPKNFTNENNIEFIISTSVTTLGGCTYDQQNFDSNQNNQAYTKNFGALSEGFYTYDVRCLTGYSFSDEVLSFVVDRSNPSILDLNINNNPTCGNSIQAEVLVEDNFGIKDINFSIEKLDGTIIKTGSTQSGSINEIFNLNDFDNTSPNMRLNVVVSDFADNKAQRSEVVTAISSQGSLCDDERPLTNLDIATTSNGLEVNVTCTDVGTAGCSNNFEYGTSENASLCVLDISRQLGQPIIFNENSYLCWTVFDNMDNNASGLEYIEFSVYPNHCFNTEQDADEEGLNCGGSCPACIYPHCSNNVTDEDEERMDCGGADCEPCGELPNHCLNNVTDEDETGIDCGGADCEPCTELHCNNTVKDEDEERVDCGGADCEPCGELPNHCLNNVTDEDETGIDCGGIDCDPCTVLHCNNNIQDYDETGIDCGGYSCEPCNILHCNNTIKDEDEERVDCGGADCEPCGELPNHCLNNVTDEDETGIDCGGIDCDPCTVLHCNNNIQDYDETGIDCGGYSCEPCNILHCNNTVKDQDEERIDCGGADCEPCGELPNHCLNNVTDEDETGIDCGGIDCDPCTELHCNNTIKDYDETGIDCGGYSCEPCNILHCNNTIKDEDEERVDCGGADCEACIELETHCTDNILNSDEEEIDCGGIDCDPCTVLHCNNSIRDYDELDVDCGGYSCEPCNETPLHCNNTILDFDEERIDCGGIDCEPCGEIELHCNNTVKDQDEERVDCGGADCEACIELETHCTDNMLNSDEEEIDCGGDDCDPCMVLHCNNTIRDYDELRVDCGGFTCEPCITPPHCNNTVRDADETGVDCGGSECIICTDVPLHCNNLIRDYDEIGIDCGGSCNSCSTGEQCESAIDCLSLNCFLGICLAPTCTDNILNQNETLIDCGGQNCDSCISEACSNGILDVFEERVDCGGNCSACPSLPSHCTNGYVDSDETDTDCGGLECVPCNADSYCDSDSDCESRQCEDNICLSESCDNDVKDGDETDIDCGGSCANCQDDDSCLEDDDCRSDNCINLICTPADADSDGDGMIDGWEDFYNFDKNDPSDAPIDSDEDGYTNLEEFIGGSNPLDPNSVPGDQDGDKMPDEWEEMYDLDKEDPLDAFEDKDGDGYTNLEEYTAGSNPTNPDSTPKSRNFIWLIFLLAGLFLIIGGVIYLYVKKQNMPDKTFSSSLSISPNQARKKSIEQKILAEEHQKELIRQKAIFEKKNQEKEQRRQSSIKGFDSDSNNKKEANAAMNDLTKSSKDKEDLGDKVLNVKSKPAKSKQTKTGFIGLDELDEELDSDDNKDEDSIFSELDSIGKEKKTSEKMKSFSKEESKKTNDSSKKEQNKSTSTKKTSKKQSTKTSKKEEKDDFEVIDVKAAATKDSNDIFKELAAISGVSHASIKKKIAEDEFDTTAIMGVFKKIKDLDGIKTETFKEIAANLLSEGHLNKDHIAEVLFHYYDKNMITKKQISDVLKELDMVKK